MAINSKSSLLWKETAWSSHNSVLHLLQIKSPEFNSFVWPYTYIISMNSFSTSKHWPHTSKFSRSFFFFFFFRIWRINWKSTENFYGNLVLWGSGIFIFIFIFYIKWAVHVVTAEKKHCDQIIRTTATVL